MQRKEKLKGRRELRNCKLLSGLREDRHADELYKAACEDSEEGRMTHPREIEFEDLKKRTLSPRFSAEQGNWRCNFP